MLQPSESRVPVTSPPPIPATKEGDAVKRQIQRFCGSCPHYDAFGDACAYQGSGCVRVRKPEPPPEPEPGDPYCHGCAYLDRLTGDCNYPGLGCVQWKKGT